MSFNKKNKKRSSKKWIKKEDMKLPNGRFAQTAKCPVCRRITINPGRICGHCGTELGKLE